MAVGDQEGLQKELRRRLRRRRGGAGEVVHERRARDEELRDVDGEVDSEDRDRISSSGRGGVGDRWRPGRLQKGCDAGSVDEEAGRRRCARA